jgi:hypothetical protein
MQCAIPSIPRVRRRYSVASVHQSAREFVILSGVLDKLQPRRREQVAVARMKIVRDDIQFEDRLEVVAQRVLRPLLLLELQLAQVPAITAAHGAFDQAGAEQGIEGCCPSPRRRPSTRVHGMRRRTHSRNPHVAIRTRSGLARQTEARRRLGTSGAQIKAAHTRRGRTNEEGS